MMVKYHRCKLGTIPSYVQLFRAYKIRVGLKVKFRKKGEYNWREAWIYAVHDDGYFKMALDQYVAERSRDEDD
jgi:hypothetical protein